MNLIDFSLDTKALDSLLLSTGNRSGPPAPPQQYLESQETNSKAGKSKVKESNLRQRTKSTSRRQRQR